MNNDLTTFKKRAREEQQKIISLSRRFAAMAAREFPGEISEFDLREAVCRCLCTELFDTRTLWIEVYRNLYTEEEILNLN
ncbi:hypothetical protein GBK02_09985 [Dechloromonas sp. TW-R-39-2]|uniref:hypothetical protein n=1 Tax=Dechloromonas sp. TW-R-39-2 TaxID=2654218 RepID=UPI00193E9782|nr:hypothetical protein [Dechloromonas sp. TW-R-39-2]QRM19707.1 hypothetical protein GBK02_09985 [Dechloromonas sp. TW-R-39-2]